MSLSATSSVSRRGKDGKGASASVSMDIETDDNTNNEKRPATGRSMETEDGEEFDSSDEEEDCTEDMITEIVRGIGSSSCGKRLDNTIRARKLLSREENPLLVPFYKAGCLDKLIPHLQRDKESTLQFEAAWAVTNIASGSTELTQGVVDAGAVPIFIRLLKSPNQQIKEQAAWALGNIAGDGEPLRNIVVRAGIIPSVLEAIASVTSSDPVTLVRVLAWVLTNLFRPKGHAIGPCERRDCLLALKQLLQHHDTEVVVDALWAVDYIAERDDDSLSDVLDCNGLVSLLVKHLNSHEHERIIPALRATGHLVVGSDEQTDAVVAEGVIPLYGRHLSPSNPTAMRRDAAWALSNITAGTKQQIQAVIDEDILPLLVKAVGHRSLELQREASWALGNLTSNGNGEQIEHLIEAGGVEALARVLPVTEISTVTAALASLNQIFKHPELGGNAIDRFEEVGGVEHVEMLQHHNNPSLSDKAKDIITNYFTQADEKMEVDS
ncbi:hypothetical protein Pmani_028518 [Petrolisthes manimaculis]|uniref:Importin subunit alpha n=1 Tax=Petrolisthes manimaculis TaxID=1843537 RepID=A0AAE1P253_9EUCA|nr:hypothetical protein Pmani_028518 [Petrolisthes manimaculis]